MPCPCKKSAIAGVAIVVVAGLVLGGGYITSILGYSSMKEQAKVTLEQQINTFMADPVSGEGAKYSVELFEPKMGFLSHDVTLVVVNGEDNTKYELPMTISASYGGYDFDFDLVHATINDDYAIKTYGLDNLTALQANAYLDSDSLDLSIKSSYLNDIDSFIGIIASNQARYKLWQNYDNLSSDEYHTAFETYQEEAKKSISEKVASDLVYKDVGTVDLNLVLDDAENVKLSLTMDSFVTDNGVILNGIKYFSHSQGWNEFKSLGRSEIAVENVAYAVADTFDQVNGLVLKTDSTKVTKAGKFDVPFSLSVASAKNFVDVKTSGKISNLNIAAFNQPDLYTALSDYFAQNAISMTFDQGSAFSVQTKLREDKYSESKPALIDVTFNGVIGSEIITFDPNAPQSNVKGDVIEVEPLDPEAATEDAQSSVETIPSFFSKFSFKVNTDVNNIDDATLEALKPFFVVKNNVSTCDFSISTDSQTLNQHVFVNGQEL